MDVKFEDHSKKFESAAAKAKQQALWAIGATAERHAKEIITQEGRVDTGRMRNSIAHAEDKDSTYVGSNVDYTIYNELGTVHMRGIHMLQKAASNYGDEYKRLAEAAYKSAEDT